VLSDNALSDSESDADEGSFISGFSWGFLVISYGMVHSLCGLYVALKLCVGYQLGQFASCQKAQGKVEVSGLGIIKFSGGNWQGLLSADLL